MGYLGGKNDSNRKASEKKHLWMITNSITSEGHGGFNNKEWISRKKYLGRKKLAYAFYSLRKINSLLGYTYRFENQ